jgi:hypothetical protein
MNLQSTTRTMALHDRADEATLRSVRRALYRRALRQIRASLDRAGADELMAAVEAETPVGTIARLVSAAPSGVATAADEWAEELLRGAQIKQELITEAGGTYSTGEVARLLGVSPQAVQQRRARGRLLAVPLGNGEWGFPVCQFTPRGVPDALPGMLASFGSDDPWVRLSVMLSREPALGGERLIDLVADGRRVDEVEGITRSYGTQGAV